MITNPCPACRAQMLPTDWNEFPSHQSQVTRKVAKEWDCPSRCRTELPVDQYNAAVVAFLKEQRPG